jgi:hypothetical protein
MIARIRGEHDSHWGRWRPTSGRKPGAAPQPDRDRAAQDTVEPALDARRNRSPLGAIWWLAALVVGATLASLAISRALQNPTPAPVQLPSSPRAWLDAYEGAAVDNPPRVCSDLFAPTLARVYGSFVHSTCTHYFARITSSSVTVLHVLQDGATAVLELRQTVNHEDWSVVLDRRRTGWQAVDLSANFLR